MTQTPLSNPRTRPADSGIHARRWVTALANSLIWLIGMTLALLVWQAAGR
jgi:hypothetical protein